MPQDPISITGIHLWRSGDHAIVSVERNGRWVEVMREPIDSPFSHIIEPAGILGAFGEKPQAVSAVAVVHYDTGVAIDEGDTVRKHWTDESSSRDYHGTVVRLTHDHEWFVEVDWFVGGKGMFRPSDLTLVKKRGA